MKLLNVFLQILDLFQKHSDPEINRYRHHGRQFILGLVGGLFSLLFAIHLQSVDLSVYGMFGPYFAQIYNILSSGLFTLALGFLLFAGWGLWQAYSIEREWYGSD